MTPKYSSRKELEERGFGPYGVLEIPHFVTKLKDGTQLAHKVWFPVSLAERAIEAMSSWFTGCDHNIYCAQGVSEQGQDYLPYRKSDYTASRDHLRHPWMASHGFVMFRTDLRGTGDSTGVYFDEYEKQEQDDACELIDWMAGQKWCNGKVGMFGYSWGGSNGLHMVSRQIPALKGVVTAYFTDNRYTDEIHYSGGCVLGHGMLSWASQMQLWNSRPPQPMYMIGDWKKVWKERLEVNTSKSLAKHWLEHQEFDSYWQHGSVGENPTLLSGVPILAIGGWHDGYTNAFFRLIRDLGSENCTAILGPWSHEWPDVAVPGPNCLKFWSRHLKGRPMLSKLDKSPALVWYQCEGVVPPGPEVLEWPGKWKTLETASAIGAESLVLQGAGTKHGLALTTQSSQVDGQQEWRVPFRLEAGLKCGEWLNFGVPCLPGDQASTFNQALTFESYPMQSDLELFGLPTVLCAFSVNADSRGMIAARLCDVFPGTGDARLISHGVQNLNRDERGKARSLQVGNWHGLKLQLDSLGYTLKAGHRLVLSLSAAYWPYAWPSRMDPQISVRKVSLKLPLVGREAKDVGQIFRGKPKIGPALEAEVLRPPKFERNVQISMADDGRPSFTITVSSDSGRMFLPHVDCVMDETERTEYTADKNDPRSAKVTTVRELKTTLRATGQHEVEIKFEASMDSADGDNFRLASDLRVELDGEEFFAKRWDENVERNLL